MHKLSLHTHYKQNITHTHRNAKEKSGMYNLNQRLKSLTMLNSFTPVVSTSVVHLSHAICGCQHMFQCSCYDFATGHLCKHIHKVCAKHCLTDCVATLPDTSANETDDRVLISKL